MEQKFENFPFNKEQIINSFLQKVQEEADRLFDSAQRSFEVSAQMDGKMTSNGETGNLRIKELKDAGLESINFSIFGTTAEEMAEIQSDRFRDPRYGAMKLKKLKEAINTSIEYGLRAKANVVIRNEHDYERVYRIMQQFGNQVELRLLPSLGEGIGSLLSIYNFLNILGAKPFRRILTAGSSNSRTDFQTIDGMEIGFKQINRITLPESCATCSMNNEDDCNEGYYGVRMYKDQDNLLKLGVCIQRMDMTVDFHNFLNSDISKEILDFRNSEFERLSFEYSQYIQS